MTTALLSNGTILVDEDLRSQARQLVAEAHDRRLQQITLHMDDGSEVELPANLARFIDRILQGLSRGPVSVTTLPDELTTTVAAELLAVSRPTLMKWVNAGQIASRKVGSHTRLSTEDVLTFRKGLSEKHRAAFEALRSFDEDFA